MIQVAHSASGQILYHWEMHLPDLPQVQQNWNISGPELKWKHAWYSEMLLVVLLTNFIQCPCELISVAHKVLRACLGTGTGSSRPTSPLTAATSYGLSIFSIASTLLGSGFTPSGVRTWEIKGVSEHFSCCLSRLSVKFLSLHLPNYLSNLASWSFTASSMLAPWHVIGLSFATLYIPFRPSKLWSSFLWKYSGAGEVPKGICK